jgi:hypothetical protein
MLFSLLFVGLLASAAIAHDKPGKNVQFAPGQTYVYEYSARLLTGIPELADQYAGFEMTADLVLQSRGQPDKVDMKLTNIKVGKTNDQTGGSYEEDIDMVHRWNKEYQRELTKPVRFQHEAGKVTAFEAERNEPDWSLNVKKSILSLFNLNLTPQKIIRAEKGNLVQKPLSAADLTYYGVYERGIGGICETVYEIAQNADPKDPHPEEAFVLNVTKTRNYDNCLTEPSFVKENFDMRGCPNVCRQEQSGAAVKGYHPVPDKVSHPYHAQCQCGHEPNASPVDQYNFVKYNISLVGAVPIIQSLLSEGKVVYNTFGDKIMVVTHQNATLQKLLPARQVTIPQIADPKRHEELGFRVPRPTIPAPQKVAMDIPYMALFGNPDVAELASNLPLLLDNLAAQIVAGEPAAAKDSAHTVVQIVNTLAAMPADALEALYKEVAQQGRDQDANAKEQIIRKLFLDALALAGSNNAALLIKQLILSNLVDTQEAKQLVEAVPQNMYLPDVKTIQAYLELAQSPRLADRPALKASASIAFGKLVNEGCVKAQNAPGDIPDDNVLPADKRNSPAKRIIAGAMNAQVQQQRAQEIMAKRAKRSAPWNAAFSQNVCKQHDIIGFVQIAARILEQANNFADKMIAIETLAHMGVPEVLQVLAPYVNGEVQRNQCPGFPLTEDENEHEECDFVRMNVIYALSHVAANNAKQVLPLVLPVYRDASESYEIRIAAFTILMLADPETQILESVASELHRENNKQVLSFVASALETVGNLTTPCFKSVADSAAEAYQYAPEAKHGIQYSKMVAKDYFDEKRQYGLFSLAEWTANNKSEVPRAGYLSIGQTNGPFHDELLQVGFQAKGMEQILDRITGPQGVLSDAFEGLNAKRQERRNKRNTDSVDQAVQALKEKLNFKPRSDDAPKASIFFKLFESTSYYTLDEATLKEIIDDSEDILKEWIQKIAEGYSGHLVKIMMPGSFQKVVPSELGLPVVISHKHPIILSLKVDNLKLDLTAHPKTPKPIGFNITAQVTPQLIYSSLTYVFGLAPASRVAFGTHVEKTTQISLPIELSVGHVRPKNLWTVSAIPKIPHEVVYHKSEAKTFISRAKLATAPNRDWLENSQTISTQAVPFHAEKKIGQDLLGMGLRVELNSEDEWFHQSAWDSKTAHEHGIVAALVEVLRNPGLQARNLHVNLEADPKTPTYGFDATFRYKWTADEENINDIDDSDESSATDESDSDDSDHSSSSSSSSSSESNSSKSKSDSKNSRSKDSSESNSSNTSEDSSSESTGASKSNSDSDSSSSSSESASKQIRKIRKIKGLKKPSARVHIHRHASGSSSSSESDSDSNGSSGSKSSASLSASSSSSSSSSSSQESASSPESSEESSSSESDSSSSSSSESDSSFSAEDFVFDYEDVMELITGHAISEHNIKKIALHLIRKTRSSWQWAWDEDESGESSSSDSSSSSKSGSSSSMSESDDSDSSSNDSSSSRSASSSSSLSESKEVAKQNQEKDIVPAFITHDVAITVTARGPRPSYLAINLLLVHTFDGRTMWVKADGHVKTPVGIYMEIPTLFCADAVVAFPQLPGEFYFDQTTQQGDKAKVKAQLGWGPQCHNEGGILVVGQLEKTEDKVWTSDDFQQTDDANMHHIRDWFYHQCQEDRADGKPASYACERAIIKESFFNQLTLDIKYKNLPREIKNLTRKADLALKVAMYDNLDVNHDAENPRDQLRVVAHYSSKVPDVPMINLLIQKPNEDVKIEKAFAPLIRPISTLLPIHEVYMNLLTGYEHTPKCVVMEHAVRTFDNVTFPLKDTKCQVLVAMDCSAEEKFAVYATELEHEDHTKKLTILTAGQQIVMMPPQQQDLMQIEVDGRVHELTADSPITFNKANDQVRIYLRKTKSDAVNPIAVLENKDEGLEILFDGKNIKVLIDNKLKGKTCGICGNNDDESENEFEGPGECIFEDAEDFVNSYSMAGEHCEVKPRAQGKVRCPKRDQRRQHDEQNQRRVRIDGQVRRNPTGTTKVVHQHVEIPQPNAQQQQQQQIRRDQIQSGERIQQRNACQKLRTEYVIEGDQVCFTTKPVNVCQSGCRAQATKETPIEFHCLPKASPFTKQLQNEADHTILKQLASKRIDFRRNMAIPTRCSA